MSASNGRSVMTHAQMTPTFTSMTLKYEIAELSQVTSTDRAAFLTVRMRAMATIPVLPSHMVNKITPRDSHKDAPHQNPKPNKTVRTILCFRCSCKAHVAGIGTTTTAKFVTMPIADVRDQTKRLLRQVSSRCGLRIAIGVQALIILSVSILSLVRHMRNAECCPVRLPPPPK